MDLVDLCRRIQLNSLINRGPIPWKNGYHNNFRLFPNLAPRPRVDNGFGGPLQTDTTKFPNKMRTDTLKKWIPQQLSPKMLCTFDFKKKQSFLGKMDTNPTLDYFYNLFRSDCSQIFILPSCQYFLPSGNTSRRFIFPQISLQEYYASQNIAHVRAVM